MLCRITMLEMPMGQSNRSGSLWIGVIEPHVDFVTYWKNTSISIALNIAQIRVTSFCRLLVLSTVLHKSKKGESLGLFLFKRILSREYDYSTV